MVTPSDTSTATSWDAAHFVGGHLVLDLTNTVYDRAHPVEDNELLRSPADVLTWCASAGLLEAVPRRPDAADSGLVDDVRAVREDAFAVLDAVARGAGVPAAPLGRLLERAGTGLGTGHAADIVRAPDRITADPAAPDEIPTVLALLSVRAFFTLPPDRVRACARCGWLFLDSSRGGRRRWCSMSTCGNREKASRHRGAGRSAG